MPPRSKPEPLPEPELQPEHSDSTDAVAAMIAVYGAEDVVQFFQRSAVFNAIFAKLAYEQGNVATATVLRNQTIWFSQQANRVAEEEA